MGNKIVNRNLHMAVVNFIFLLFASIITQITHDTEFCDVQTDQANCVITFGCEWNSGGGWCQDGSDFKENLGTCQDARNQGETFTTSGPIVCSESGGYWMIYDNRHFDQCSYDQYVSQSFSTCDTANGCFTDPLGFCYTINCLLNPNIAGCACILDPYATGCTCNTSPWTTGCYSDTTNAGICEGRNTYGCGAIPFCKWNSSCQPDWKCYYSNTSHAICDTRSSSDGGAACKTKTIGRETYCTSDTITSADEECILAGTDKDACVAKGCEWIEPGTDSAGDPYTGWCTQVGSGASIVRKSAVVLMVILSVMLSFF